MRALGAFVLLALSASSRADGVDDVIKASMAKDHIPGVAVGVIRDGKLVVARGYGVANMETNSPVTPETVFRIASMSKEFCAASILMLQAEGKLSIEDPVSKYFDGTPAAWKGIKLRHLLGHQSGIHEINDTKGYDFRDDYTAPELLKLMEAQPLDFEPGAKFSYSNSGYYILGWVVQKVSGQSLKEFVESRIFGPAGMTHARYFRQDDVIPNRANAYRWSEKEGYTNGWPERSPAADGSGAVICTLADWAKWDAALDAGTPVSKAIQTQMGTAGTFNDGKRSPYGFGWYDDGGGKVHHTGSTYGFTSAFIRDPVRHVTVVVFRNANGGPALRMAQDVLDAFLKLSNPK